jgi:hypothetical protein
MRTAIRNLSSAGKRDGLAQASQKKVLLSDETLAIPSSQRNKI